jgi:sugar/nucleoside kinase (ribokinase family)
LREIKDKHKTYIKRTQRLNIHIQPNLPCNKKFSLQYFKDTKTEKTMKKKYDIMVAGHVCFDLIPGFMDSGATQIQEIITPGKLVNIGECTMSTGGPVSNTGIGLKTLGHRVSFSARIGDDIFGELTRDFLDRSGNAEGIRVMPNQSSSYTIALSPPNIDRILLHNPGTNNFFSPDDLNPELIHQCKHFHFGYPPLMANMYRNGGAALKKVFQIAKESGAITSCDMSLPDPTSESGDVDWIEILSNILPFVDIFLPSIEEVSFMLEKNDFLKMREERGGEELIDFFSADDYSRLAGKLIDLGTSMTSLKTGHRGFYFKTGSSARIKNLCDSAGISIQEWSDREAWCPAFKVTPIASATGSGDSSISGFLAAFLRQLPLEKCLRYACILGWQNLQSLDAVSGIKSWEESSRLLQEDLPLINPQINHHDWQWIEAHQLWAGPNDLVHM